MLKHSLYFQLPTHSYCPWGFIGRAKVSSDPEGASFPWFPTTIQQDLGSHVLDNNGEQVPLSSLNGKYLALYFSAHWCPPCKRCLTK